MWMYENESIRPFFLACQTDFSCHHRDFDHDPVFHFQTGSGCPQLGILSTSPKEGMMKGGILPAIVGTGYLVLFSILFAFPIGVLAGIYVNEYALHGRVKILSRR